LKAVLYDYYDNMQSSMEKAIADSLEIRAEWADLLDESDDTKIIEDAETAYNAWRGAVMEQLKQNGVFNYEYAGTVIAACKEMMKSCDGNPRKIKKNSDVDADDQSICKAIVYLSNLDCAHDEFWNDWIFWKNLACFLLNSSNSLKTDKSWNKGDGYHDYTFIPATKNSYFTALKDLCKGFNDESTVDSDPKKNFEKNLALARDCFGDEHFLDYSKEMLQRVLRLERFALECLEKVFSDEMECDFEEISRSAVKASAPDNNDPEASFKIDEYLMEDDRIVHILVDEYQDTSRSQFLLLNNFIRGWQPIPCAECLFKDKCGAKDNNTHRECDVDGHTVFCVGDPMQSIYRFRGADVSVYTHTQNSGFDCYEDPGAGYESSFKPEELHLQCNFRSRHRLVRALGDDMFAPIFPEEPSRGSVDIGIINFAPSEPAAAWEGANSDDSTIKFIEAKPVLINNAFENIFTEDKINSFAADTETGLTEEAKALLKNYSAAVYEAALITDEIARIRKEDENKAAKDKRTIAVLLESKDLGTEILRRLQSMKIPVAQKEVCSLDKAEPVPLLVAITNVFLNVLERRFWFAILRSKLVGLNMKEVAVLMERVLDDEAEKVGRYNPPKDFWHSLSLVSSKDGKMRDLLKKAGMSEKGLEACRRLYKAYSHAYATRRSMGLADSVRGLWMRLGGPALCSREEAANAEQYFEFLKRFDERGEWPNVKTLEDGLSQLFAESSMDENNPVQFLTVHGAKGLEFDYVFLPGLASKQNPRTVEKLINVSSFGIREKAVHEYRLLSPIIKEKDGKNSQDRYFYETVERLNKEGERHEKVRLFYVAATRAKRCVYLYIHIKHANNKQTQDRDLIMPKNDSKMLSKELWMILAEKYLRLRYAENKNKNYTSAYESNSDFERDYLRSYLQAMKSEVSEGKQIKNTAVPRLKLDWANRLGDEYKAKAEPWQKLWEAETAGAQTAVSDDGSKPASEAGTGKAEESGKAQQKQKPNKKKKALGTLVHELLEKLANLTAEYPEEYTDENGELCAEKFSDEILKKLIEEAEIKENISDKDLNEIRCRAGEILRKVLESKKGRWVLRPRPGAAAEEEFQCWAKAVENDSRGHYCKRIIDRTFVEDGVCWIIDYKTGARKKGESLDAFYEHKLNGGDAKYADQLRGYAKIKKTLLGDRISKVKAALYFPRVENGEGWCEIEVGD
ncbi:UvrD-helicase domain-containing protein, partial [bacterium]|nr:UvrD-helicase domain-containing protein [bacterium]